MSTSSTAPNQERPDVVYCAAHPNVETGLSCGRCGKPICPRCMVQTPVGARCRDCARMRRLPTFDVSPAQYALAAAAGLGVSVVLGGFMALVPGRGYFMFFAAAAVGYVAGEAISRSVAGKRSTGLKVIAGLAVITTFAVAAVFPFAKVLGIAALGLLPAAVMAMLTSPLSLLAIALGIYIAVNRIG